MSLIDIECSTGQATGSKAFAEPLKRPCSTSISPARTYKGTHAPMHEHVAPINTLECLEELFSSISVRSSVAHASNLHISVNYHPIVPVLLSHEYRPVSSSFRLVAIARSKEGLPPQPLRMGFVDNTQ